MGEEKRFHVVVAANGDYGPAERLLPIVDEADCLIAADGGANWLARHGRWPQVLIGDLDSVASEVRQVLEEGPCRVVRHRPDKDETDTELALREAVAMGAERITLLGALGGRLDHTLANILLLAMPQLQEAEVVIYDGHARIFLLRGEGTICGQVGDTVSLLPLAGDAEGIVTEGLRYPLRGEALRFGLARGVSNVLEQPCARVSVGRGMLLVVHTPAEEDAA
jgi:thiamine pyrophosphokinase